MADLIRIPSKPSLSRVMTPTVLNLTGHRKLHVFNGERQKGSPRQYWSENFQDVAVIVFTFDLCSYNEFRPDNPRQTILVQSLVLWDAVINCEWFTKSMIFLVMSNAAEFKEQINVYPLSDTFPTFTGGDDAHKAVQFILDCFGNAKRLHREKGLEQYLVDPTDPGNVQNLWLDVEDILYRLENRIRGRLRMHPNQANCMYIGCPRISKANDFQEERNEPQDISEGRLKHHSSQSPPPISSFPAQHPSQPLP
jgi:hypothetical protein